MHVDLVGPLPWSTNRRRYVFTILDRFTRWIVAVPLKTITTEEVCKAFYENWVCLYGVPDFLVTDRGGQFRADTFEELCASMDIKHAMTTPYHPRSNGIIERAHATLKQVIRCLSHKFRDWEAALPTALFAMRTAINDLGVSPSLLVYGEHIAIPGVYTFPEMTFNEACKSEFVRNLPNHWFQIRDFVLKHDATLSGNDESLKTGPYPHKYVWVTEPVFKGALYPKVRGPYEVVQFQWPVVTCQIGDEQKKFNMDRCKPAFLIDEEYF